MPLFEHLDSHWDHVFEIQNQYSFFYQDTLEIIRYDELIAEEYRRYINWGKDQYFNMLRYNISRGVFTEQEEEDLKQKATQIWLVENTWLHGSSVAGLDYRDVDDFKEQLWHCLFPLFSHLGEQEYDQLVKFRKIPI